MRTPTGDPLPALAAMREELTAYHSPYYIGGSAPPAPIHITNGWADDLFPADEAIRFYNRTRTRYPGAPISLFLADLGHGRGQSKLADFGAMAARQAEWFDHYVKGVGQQPFLGVEARTQTCPPDSASGGPYYAPTWAEMAPGEVRIEASATERIAPGAGSPTVAQAFDPVTGDGACAAVPATDQAGTATYRGQPVPASGFTLLGSATLVADITSRGATSQIAARLLDVDPGTDTETLVARGLWRPLVANGPRAAGLPTAPERVPVRTGPRGQARAPAERPSFLRAGVERTGGDQDRQRTPAPARAGGAGIARGARAESRPQDPAAGI